MECDRSAEIIEGENIIENPSQEVLKKAFEIPIMPQLASVNFVPENEGRISKFSYPFIQVEFSSYEDDGVFIVRNQIVKYGNKCDKEQFLENVQNINERLINGSKSDFVKYDCDKFGFETLRDTRVDDMFKAGYRIESLEMWLSFPRGYGYSNSTLRLESIGERSNKLILSIKKEDDDLSSEQKEGVQIFFNDLKNISQQK